MADYKYLKENNLFEAHLRFVRALGEGVGFGYSPLEEEDDNQDQQPPAGGDPNAMGGQDPMMGGAPGGGPDQMGGAPDGMGGMPAGGDPNAMGGGQPPMPAGGAPGGGEEAAGPDPMMGGSGPDDFNLDDEPKEEDNVLDVDDLTDAQETLNDKINSVGRDLGKVDSRIEKLLGAIDKLSTMFDKNNQEISDLRSEFEKRNPTQTEKLNLRSIDSYPFVNKPNEWWDEKSKNSNYSAYFNNDEPTTQEYVITNNDIDDFSEREIADSFSIDDEFKNLDINKIFGL